MRIKQLGFFCVNEIHANILNQEDPPRPKYLFQTSLWFLRLLLLLVVVTVFVGWGFHLSADRCVCENHAIESTTINRLDFFLLPVECQSTNVTDHFEQ